jgi:hypothetical protein
MKLNTYTCNEHFRRIFSTKAHQGKPEHIAIFWFLTELNNRLNWIDDFGLPIYNAMEEVKIRNLKTFSKYLQDLHDWGIIEILSKSVNQHTSTVVSIKSAMAKFDEAHDEAHDEALPRHMTKHLRGTATINKLLETNKNLETNKPINEQTKIYFSEKYESSFPIRQEKDSTPPPIPLTPSPNVCQHDDMIKIVEEETYEYFRSLDEEQKDMIKDVLGLNKAYVYQKKGTAKFQSFTRLVYDSYILTEAWVEHARIYPKLSTKKFQEKLREFIALKVAGEEYRDFNDIIKFKQHFGNWLKHNWNK